MFYIISILNKQFKVFAQLIVIDLNIYFYVDYYRNSVFGVSLAFNEKVALNFKHIKLQLFTS